MAELPVRRDESHLTGMYVEQKDAEIFWLWIPNGEIRKLFYELFEDWFREVTRTDALKINRFCSAFLAGEVQCRERAGI